MSSKRPNAVRRERATLRAAVGCGIDVVELSRLRQVMRRSGPAFLRRVFTPAELAYARARRRTELLHLAGRFAAKEAVIKAISQLAPGVAVAMQQIDIRNDRLGRPSIRLHHPKLKRLTIHVSLSHVESVAVASALAMR
jgi:holo-[acyl-carrier protein] synthase